MTGLAVARMDQPKGHEVMHVTCRACGHRRELTGTGNALVGKQAQLRCSRCGNRGADLLRVWHVTGPPREP